MYYYLNGNYQYYGDKTCGTPVKEIRTISDKEGKYWDNVEKQIRKNKSKEK